MSDDRVPTNSGPEVIETCRRLEEEHGPLPKEWNECLAVIEALHRWYDETDSEEERPKHPEQFDMWITGYEQAMLDVNAILKGGAS